MSNLRAGLAIFLLAAIWLAALAFGGPRLALDTALLHDAQHGTLVPVARLLTAFGNWTTQLLLAAAGAAWLLSRRRYRDMILLLAIALSCRLLVELQKVAFARLRPDPHGQLVAVRTLSFPSGHAANSMAALLGFALLAVAGPKLRLPAILLAVALSVLIGLSRLVLGVHWPSDVVGGWAFGAGWTLLLTQSFAGTTGAHRH
jgi:undecaprenyl-diphosphatase